MGDYAVTIMKYLSKKAFLVEDNFDLDVLSMTREAVFCAYNLLTGNTIRNAEVEQTTMILSANKHIERN